MTRSALAVLLLAAAPAWAAQTNVGGETAQFLEIGAGARALGMGEAYGPLAEGPEAIYWNVAGLAQERGPELSYSRSELYGQIHHDFLAYAQPVSALGGTLGISYTRLDQDKLPIVTNANQQIGQFSPHSDAWIVGYARSFDLEGAIREDRDYFGEKWDLPGTVRPFTRDIGPWSGRLMVGLALEGVSEHIYQHSGNAVALNGGALWHPTWQPRLALSFAFRNAFGQEKFNIENDKLPFELDVGAAYDQHGFSSRFVPSAEVGVPYFGIPFLKLGGEFSRPMNMDMVGAVRAGINTRSMSDLGVLSGFTMGLGLRYRKLNFDFAFEPMSDLGQSIRFTTGYHW